MEQHYGTRGFGAKQYRGLIKVKLVHAPGKSLIIPDQIYLEDPLVWFQPRTWLPNTLVYDGESIQSLVVCDIVFGHTLRIQFSDADFVNSFPDGSFLYHCEITGPDLLSRYSTGQWRFERDRPHLKLYHHTGRKALKNIKKTEELWASLWNIQGTSRVKGAGYVYLTPLKRISTDEDLEKIAMSRQKALHFLRDGANVPHLLPLGWQRTRLADDVLELPVYWSSPGQRRKTLEVYVDATALSPQHAWWHPVAHPWYEVVAPDVVRVGLKDGRNLSIVGDSCTPPEEALLRPGYIVLGDASTLDGLAAPMREDRTTHNFKIHHTSACPLKFWFSRSNEDHYSVLGVSELQFE